MVMEVYNLLLCGIITPLQFHLTPILITWGKFYSEDFFFSITEPKGLTIWRQNIFCSIEAFVVNSKGLAWAASVNILKLVFLVLRETA